MAIDWTLDVLFGKDLVQYQTERSEVLSGDHHDGGRIIPPTRTDGTMPPPAAIDRPLPSTPDPAAVAQS